MYVMGISALYHDAAAVLIKDGEIIAAAQEERFTRIKHDKSIPGNAIAYCLSQAKITGNDLDAIVYYDNPILTTERFLDNLQYVGKDAEDLIDYTFTPLFAQKIWVHKRIESAIHGLGIMGELYVTEHHISHAASAFYPSPYNKAAIVTMDGVGEWATTTIGYGENNKIKLLKEIRYPHSLGLLYSAFTYFCGFKVNSGDYKLMGLAPYGDPIYYDLIKRELICIKPDGSFRLNLDYFDFQYGRAMTNEKFAQLFNGPRRQPESRITKREMDMAASVQKVLEEVVIRIVRYAKTLVPENVDELVLAGGVALNCVANGKLLKENIFKKIWIQPAAGDAGGAMGAALFYYYQFCNNRRESDGIHDKQKGTYLGPQYSQNAIESYLKQKGYPYTKYENHEDLYKAIAELIDRQNVIGLFAGRMEYGPRALGNRSIIGDARSSQMQSRLNLKIKFRESFRPFAPSVLEECAQDYFELGNSPYMLLCAEIREELRKEFDLKHQMSSCHDNMVPVVNFPRSVIPAVTHVDYSARVQTVTKETNLNYYEILKEFEKRTGCGVIINTSFNVRGEPIVCTPDDAYKCFMRTEMDILVLENMILYKKEQPEWAEETDWREQYELD